MIDLSRRALLTGGVGLVGGCVSSNVVNRVIQSSLTLTAGLSAETSTQHSSLNGRDFANFGEFGGIGD